MVKVSNNLQAAESGISTFAWRCETRRAQLRADGGQRDLQAGAGAGASESGRVPAEVSEVTRAYFGGQAKLDRTSEKDTLAAPPRRPAAIERVAGSSRLEFHAAYDLRGHDAGGRTLRATRCRNLPPRNVNCRVLRRIVGRCLERSRGRGTPSDDFGNHARRTPASPLEEDLVRTMSAVTTRCGRMASCPR